MISVLPVNDIMPHDEFETTCPCGPELEIINGEMLLTHNSFDGRELLERKCSMKFRKKPIVIEAVQWTGENLREIIDFTRLNSTAMKWTWEEFSAVVAKEGLKIFTLEGPLQASVGDWIIRGVKGEFYPCKSDIFEATYDKAE